MDTKSVVTAYRRYINHRAGFSKKDDKAISKVERKNNKALAKADPLHGSTLIEYKHHLTDYRNGNAVICTKAMTVEQAFLINKRLSGTGFAFARVGGY